MPSLYYPIALSTNSTSGDSLIPWPGPSTSNIRSTYDVLWSCLVTIFACVYTALHMNIPARHDSKWRRFRRRVKWVFINFLAPEIATSLALTEYLACRRHTSLFRKETNCNSEDWSLTHSFYSTMGGVRITLPTGEVFPAFPDEIAALVKQKLISFPIITKAEIEDKSKTDYLGKAFACSQVLWFAINVASRASQHLAVTPLELTTVAYVTVTLVAYIAWWNKPSDIQVPTVIDGSQFPEKACDDLRRDHQFALRAQKQHIPL